jgi:putative intracellular protease/amidase
MTVKVKPRVKMPHPVVSIFLRCLTLRCTHKEGYEIDFVSPKGGKTHVDGLDLSDPVNASFWNNDSLREATKTTLKPSQIDPDVYDAVYYAGGHATMWDLLTI